MGEMTLPAVEPAWRLAQVLLGDRTKAEDTVVSVLDAQVEWLAPPSEPELLAAVAREAGPDAVPAEGEGFWGADPDQRAALWLTAVDGRSEEEAGEILALAPRAVAVLADRAGEVTGPHDVGELLAEPGDDTHLERLVEVALRTTLEAAPGYAGDGLAALDRDRRWSLGRRRR